jgi:tRNA(fMet)-specific endonuclease VapC
MERTLLDTDIFSEVLKRKHRHVAEVAAVYHQQFGSYTISTITVLEVIKGFHKVDREAAIQTFLENIAEANILTLTTKSAELAGRIYAELERTGQPIGRADPMIAAIAVTENLLLATGNTKHYERIQQLGYALRLTNWKTEPLHVAAPDSTGDQEA